MFGFYFLVIHPFRIIREIVAQCAGLANDLKKNSSKILFFILKRSGIKKISLIFVNLKSF